MDPKDLLADAPQPSERLLSSDIRVDREGDWYYQEDKITREDILELFLTNLRLASGGTYVIEWKGQRCALEVADTPFVVTRVDRLRPNEGSHEQILIQMKHLPDPETLDLLTFRIGAGNVPYCTIREGRFRARFSRPAYYQLAAWIDCDPDTGAFYLELNDTRYPIAMADHAPSQDDRCE